MSLRLKVYSVEKDLIDALLYPTLGGGDPGRTMMVDMLARSVKEVEDAREGRMFLNKSFFGALVDGETNPGAGKISAKLNDPKYAKELELRDERGQIFTVYGCWVTRRTPEALSRAFLMCGTGGECKEVTPEGLVSMENCPCSREP